MKSYVNMQISMYVIALELSLQASTVGFQPSQNVIVRPGST